MNLTCDRVSFDEIVDPWLTSIIEHFYEVSFLIVPLVYARVCALNAWIPYFIAAPIAFLLAPFDLLAECMNMLLPDVLAHTTWMLLIVFLATVLEYTQGKRATREDYAWRSVLILAILV